MHVSKQLLCFNDVSPYFSHHFHLFYENLPPIQYGRNNCEEPYCILSFKIFIIYSIYIAHYLIKLLLALNIKQSIQLKEMLNIKTINAIRIK